VAERGDEDLHTTDVAIVPRPLTATSQLARIAETGTRPDPTADCYAMLLAHARRLGANALYVMPSERASCSGIAYQVRHFTSKQSDAMRAYTADLSAWLRARWTMPADIPEAERAKLCVVFQFNVNVRVQIVFVRKEPIFASGDPRFDESARRMMEKVMADGAELPRPPTTIAPEEFLMVRVALPGGPTARCG
jgi:hypothetical protein